MIIGGVQKLSLIDYPQKLAATIFLVGCNFRCPFCYNPELVLPEKIKEHSFFSQKEVLSFLKERKGLLEGVCLGGGEPTIHQDLPKFCQKIKKMGYLIKLDTNGSNPEMLKELIEKNLIDYLAIDVKAPKEKYLKVIGQKGCSQFYLLEKIEKSFSFLKENKIEGEFRTTACPKLLTRRDIFKIAQWIRPAKRYVLQNFRPEKTLDCEFEKIKPYPDEFFLSLKETLSPFFETILLR